MTGLFHLIPSPHPWSCNPARACWVITTLPVFFSCLPSGDACNPPFSLGTHGFCDPISWLFLLWMRLLLLELIFFCSHLLSSMKTLVPSTESLCWLNQAKSLAPVEYKDDPLKVLVLLFSYPWVLGMPMTMNCSEIFFPHLSHPWERCLPCPPSLS